MFILFVKAINSIITIIPTRNSVAFRSMSLQLLFLRVGRTKKTCSPLQVRRELKRVLVNLGLRSRFSHLWSFHHLRQTFSICFLRFYYVPKIWEQLGGGFKYFLCSSLLGEMIEIWLIFFKWVETTNQSKTWKTLWLIQLFFAGLPEFCRRVVGLLRRLCFNVWTQKSERISSLLA